MKKQSFLEQYNRSKLELAYYSFKFFSALEKDPDKAEELKSKLNQLEHKHYELVEERARHHKTAVR